MTRPIPPERRAIVILLLQEAIDVDAAAIELGVSRRSVLDLKRRYLRSKLLTVQGTTTVPVDAPATIRRDEWGVAHVEATSVADCYAALGYAMAQDRLWQLDHMRRLAHGQLAEVLGARYLRQDRLHRTIGLTSSARAAVAVMSAEVRTVAASSWKTTSRTTVRGTSLTCTSTPINRTTWHPSSLRTSTSSTRTWR